MSIPPAEQTKPVRPKDMTDGSTGRAIRYRIRSQRCGMHIEAGYINRLAPNLSLRDSKDLRFGMGMGSVHVSTPERRDRLWLINGLAVVLLTLLGAASEAVGYDRMLKTNTSKRREHSLFRQGCMVYDLIPTMPEHWLQPLVLAFTRLLDQQPLFSRTLGLV